MKGDFEIQVDEKYIISQLQNGEQMNPYYSLDLDAYALNMKKRGWRTWNGDGNLHAEVKELSIQELFLIMSLDNGEVYYFSPWIKISELNINNEVSEGLPGRDYLDGRVKTWNEYFLEIDKDGNPPMVDGVVTRTISANEEGFIYYNALVPGERMEFTGTEIMIISNSVDCELVEELPLIEGI